MFYFKWLSIALGAIMVAGGLWVVLCREAARRVAEKIYPEKKLSWVNLSSFVAFILVLYTWIALFLNFSSYAFVVTFVATLTFLKVILVPLFYGKYRLFLFGVFEEPVALRAAMLSSVAIGIALLFLGIFL